MKKLQAAGFVLLLALSLLFDAALAAPAAPESLGGPMAFDLAAGDATTTLKEFAAQANREIIFSSAAVGGVRTNPVHGEFTVHDALERMLTGTGLIVGQDQRTGAIAVRNGSANAEATKLDLGLANLDPAGSGEVVRMSAFKVTTDLGSYAEATTSAASKVPTEVKDLPYTVQIFNASAIKDHLAKTLADIFPYVVGMTQEAPNEILGFNLRGFTSTAQGAFVNLQYDNLPGVTTRFGSPSTANVERVEFIKGPTSILYGELAPGGLVNVVLKSPKAISETTFSASVASYSGQTSSLGEAVSYIGTIDSTGPIDAGKHWLYRLVVSGNDLTNYRRYSSEKDYYILPSMTYRWNADTSFTAKVDITNERRHSDDFLAQPPFLNPAFFPSIKTTYQGRNDVDRDWGESLSTLFQHTFADAWKLTVATRSVSHGDSRHAFRTSTAGVVVNATPVSNSTVKRYYQNKKVARGFNFFDANVYGDIGPESFRQTLLFGANGGIERSYSALFATGTGAAITSTVNYYNPILDASPYLPDTALVAPTLTAVHYYNLGLYFSDRIRIASRWNVLVGIRDDRRYGHSLETLTQAYHQDASNTVLPQAGLIYELSGNASLYVSYSQSFKPTQVDPSVVNIDGTRNFNPETGNQIEAGFKSEFMNRRLIVNVAVYDIKKQNVLTPTGANNAAGFGISTTIGAQESKGVELETTWLPVPNWQVQFGGTYLDARTTKAPTVPALVGIALANDAHLSGNLWTRYNVPDGALKGLGLGLGLIYQGARLGGLPLTASWQLPAYLRVDNSIYYQWRRYSLALNVQNSLDRHYIASTGDAQVFPGEPRKMTLSLTIPF